MKNNLNLYIALLLIISLIFCSLTIFAFGHTDNHKISTSARSAVLYVPETGSFLYSKNANQRLPMASTTKIMTALVALDRTKLDDVVVIDESSVGIEGSSAYLKVGDVLTMEELLYALLLQSANDAATAIAYYISGGIDSFSSLMNDKAASLGLKDTNFKNPHGLDDSEHFTTASDLAIITAEAMKIDTFKSIVSTYKKSFCTDERSRTYINHNKLLRMYDGCVGVKTGFTKKSGRCLVAAAERDGLTFITVTLDAPGDWNDHRAMFEHGFNSLKKISFAKQEEYCYKIPVIGGETNEILISNQDEASIITENSDFEIKEQTKLIKYAVAPITKGDILGEIIFTVDGKEMSRVNLVANETILKKKAKSLIDKFFSLFN